MQLKSMSLDRLMDLREKVEVALQARIEGARTELVSRLNELSPMVHKVPLVEAYAVARLPSTAIPIILVRPGQGGDGSRAGSLLR
jgi:hypothetical protein